MRSPRWTWIPTLAAVLVTAVAFPARSETARDKATRLARAAAVLVEEGKYDDALALFEKAYQLDPVPILLGHMGKVYEKKGNLPKAREMYERFVATETDPERLAKGRELLEGLSDRMPGRLVVTASPAGAEVRVDGRPVAAGTAVELRRGTHEVEVSLKGHAPAKRAAEVTPGGETRLAVQLLPLPGRVEVRGPAGARVTVNGRDAKTLPLDRPYVVPPGLHVVEVAAEGFEKWVKTVEVKPNTTVGVEAVLAAPPPRPGPASGDVIRKAAEVRSSPWPWVCIGTGAAALATGGVMSGLAYHERGKVSGASREGDVVTSMDMTEAASHRSKARTYDKVSYAMYGVGVAAVAAGVILWVALPATEPASGAPMAAASPVPGGMAVSAAWRF